RRATGSAANRHRQALLRLHRGRRLKLPGEPGTGMTQPPDEETPPTFEASLAQLQQVVNDLEEGKLGLETSLARFEEGIRLLRSCYKILEAAEQKIEILAGLNDAGEPVTEPFDASATFEGGERPAHKPGRRRNARAEPKADDSSAGFDPPEREEGGLF